MANLWNNLHDEKWTPTELRSAAVLSKGSIKFMERVRAPSAAVLLYPHASNTRLATWALLAPVDSKVRINDSLLETGIRVLTDRDAIRVADMPTMYFSTERLAVIEAYPDAEPVYCARCRTLICEGDAAVCCNQCGVWHHEQAAGGKACWSYATTCTSCDQSTDLDSAAYRWTPENLST